MSGQQESGIDHDENCAACGVHDRIENSRFCESCHNALVRADGGQQESGSERPEQKPLHEDKIRKAIFELTLELHKRGHTRKEIVARLRDVADDYEDHFAGCDTWGKAPHEKNVVLPGDYDQSHETGTDREGR